MKGRILVVDDDEDIRGIVQSLLKTADYEAVDAPDLASARRALSGPPPAAVLLDLNLPDGNGLDFVSEVKRAWPDTKIVILTGDHTVATAEAAFKADGQVFLLNKPFDAEVMLALLELALSQKKSAGPATG